MKKLTFTLLILLAGAVVRAVDNLPAQTAFATERATHTTFMPSPQDDDYAQLRQLDAVWKDRARYFNIAYVFQTLTFTDLNNLKWRSDFGLALSSGKTYYLHQKPLAGMMKFGIDWTMCDLNYAKYSDPAWTHRTPGDNSDEDDLLNIALGLHQADIAMQVGPSFTINPVDHLKVGLYFHYVPTFSMVILDDELGYNYVSFFDAGLSVAYRFIAIGFDYRWGNARYNNLSINDVNEDMDSMGDLFSSFSRKLRTNSFRLYASFRF